MTSDGPRTTREPEPILLNDWIERTGVKEEMTWRGAALGQFANWRLLAEQHGEPAVVSSHTSKSIPLPVVQFTLENHIVVTMRDNFHDYCVSVRVPGDEYTLRGPYFHRFMKEGARGYFEGFRSEDNFGSYEENQNRFSRCLGGFLELQVLMDECERARFHGDDMLEYLYPPCPTCGSTRIYMTHTSPALPLSCSVCCPMCATCGPTSPHFLRHPETASLAQHERQAAHGWYWLCTNAGWERDAGGSKQVFLSTRS